MTNIKIDELDEKILELLQEGAASPNISLIGKKLGKPTTTIHSRIRRLEKNNVISGYRADINDERIGGYLTTFALVDVNLGFDPDELLNKVKSIQQVKEVYYLTGEWDMLLKLKVSGVDEYYKIATKQLGILPEINKVMGMMAQTSLKE